jgi:hypothetical protein
MPQQVDAELLQPVEQRAERELADRRQSFAGELHGSLDAAFGKVDRALHEAARLAQ